MAARLRTASAQNASARAPPLGLPVGLAARTLAPGVPVPPAPAVRATRRGGARGAIAATGAIDPHAGRGAASGTRVDPGAGAPGAVPGTRVPGVPATRVPGVPATRVPGAVPATRVPGAVTATRVPGVPGVPGAGTRDSDSPDAGTGPDPGAGPTTQAAAEVDSSTFSRQLEPFIARVKALRDAFPPVTDDVATSSITTALTDAAARQGFVTVFHTPAGGLHPLHAIRDGPSMAAHIMRLILRIARMYIRSSARDNALFGRYAPAHPSPPPPRIDRDSDSGGDGDADRPPSNRRRTGPHASPAVRAMGARDAPHTTYPPASPTGTSGTQRARARLYTLGAYADDCIARTLGPRSDLGHHLGRIWASAVPFYRSARLLHPLHGLHVGEGAHPGPPWNTRSGMSRDRHRTTRHTHNNEDPPTHTVHGTWDQPQGALAHHVPQALPEPPPREGGGHNVQRAPPHACNAQGVPPHPAASFHRLYARRREESREGAREEGHRGLHTSSPGSSSEAAPSLTHGIQHLKSHNI